MFCLLIDTVSPHVSIGLARGTSLVAQECWESSGDLAETLAECIQTLLHRHGNVPTDLAQIIVHAGPGGFTTLRIGVVTANAMGSALCIPVRGVTGSVPSLADLLALASAADTGKKGPVIPLYDRPPNIHEVPTAG